MKTYLEKTLMAIYGFCKSSGKARVSEKQKRKLPANRAKEVNLESKEAQKTEWTVTSS